MAAPEAGDASAADTLPDRSPLDAARLVDAAPLDAATSRDAFLTDGPVADGSEADAPRPDASDGALPDAAAPDASEDAGAPPPDAGRPELDWGWFDVVPFRDATPDAPEPDAPVPDAAALDLAPDLPPAPDAGPDAARDVPGADATPSCPANPPPWRRERPLVGGVVVFNEIAPGAFVELFNQNTVDVDVGGWSLRGDLSRRLPAETRIPGRGFLLVEADEWAVEGVLELYSNGGRRMDLARYGERPWPTLPDEPGLSFAKRDPDLASPPAESWEILEATPGAPNRPVAGRAPQQLVAPDARWRITQDAPPPDWATPGFDDSDWVEGAAPLHAGAPLAAAVSARFTADNHCALFVGGRDGAGLRYLGRNDNWTLPADFGFEAGPEEHLFVAAWEQPADGSTQMLLGEVVRPDGTRFGTEVDTFEVALGPANATFGPLPPEPEALAGVVAAADRDASWGPPRARADRASGPWGGVLAGAFGAGAFLWLDTFAGVSRTNSAETYALFRSIEPVAPPPGGTALEPGTGAWLRHRFDFHGAPEEAWLTLELEATHPAVVHLGGRVVHRHPGGAGSVAVPLPSERLEPGENLLAVELAVADAEPVRFRAALRATPRPAALEALALPPSGPVVINELLYHPPRDGAPPTDEWIELHNPTEQPVDLSGWQLVDAITWEFAPGTTLEAGGYLVVARDAQAFGDAWPEVPVVGDFGGRLGDAGDRVLLVDGCGAAVDEVRYADGGRWPPFADGDASLELRDPRADNDAPEAWAASDEAARGEWQEIRWRGVAAPSAVGPDGQWEELVVGLLAAGEVLLDEVRVVEDPDGEALQLVRNPTFDGPAPDGWRLLGTHRHSRVEGGALRLVADGPTEHMHNHAETTLLAPIVNGRTYEISMRARWLGGSNQLNARLYFNRLARTVEVPRPGRPGTPGAPNSRLVENLGPTFSELAHGPVVPLPGEPVRISVAAWDPDGVASVTVWAGTAGEALEPSPMAEVEEGRFEALLPGRPAGALVQFHVEAVDGAGASAAFPAAGPDSRALYVVDDGADGGALPKLRLLMHPADVALFHAPTRVMSNERLPATLVWDDREAFYDVGVRAKGSERGRPVEVRLGYNVAFDPQRLLRGVYSTVSLDRSEGVRFGQRELLMDTVMALGGSPSAEHNDLAWLVAPRPAQTGPVLLQLARFGDLMLDNQFDRGADGRLFEYELVYYPTTTDDGTPEGYKLPQPDRVAGTPIRDLGEDPEAYRHTFTIKNNRRADDFAGIIAFAQVFGMGDVDFRAHVASVVDVDQWLRAFAFATLSGAVDHYAGGAQHNVQFYVRPADQRVLMFNHDLDFYPGDPRRALVANQDLRRLLTIPGNTRLFYGHLLDILRTVYNADAMAHWRDHYGALLPGQDFAGHHAFLAARSEYALREAPDAVLTRFPEVPFAITTNGGAPLEVAADHVVLEGTGWIDVRTVVRGGAPVSLAWLDETRWRAELSLFPGPNGVALTALGFADEVVGEAEIQVTYSP